MRKQIFTLLLFASLAAQAQERFYVCEKFDSDGFNVADKEFVFNADKTAFTIGDETYEVADVDSIVFNEPQFDCVKVKWSGSSATVSIPSSITGVTYTTSGGHVTITSTNTSEEILYVLEGESSDGSLTLNGSYKLTMHLNGVNLTSTKGAAIDIECGKRIELKLMKGTVNTLVDRAGGTQKAALYTKGHLEIKGKGELNVTGKTKHAICAKEYLKIKSSTGTINVLGAVSDGIHCGEGSKLAADAENCQFTINGGTVNISGCGSDCVDADDYGSMHINGGTMNLDISQTDGTGLKCDSIIYMTGGTIDLNLTGNISKGLQFNYDGKFSGGTITGKVAGNGCKGFKAKKVTTSTGTVRNGGDAHFSGTDVTLTVSGGTYTTDGTTCGGMMIDKDMYQTGGTLHVTVSNSAASGITVKGTDHNTGGTRTID